MYKSVAYFFGMVLSVFAQASLVEESVVQKRLGGEASDIRSAEIPADQIFKGNDDFTYRLSHDGRFIASVKIFEGKYFVVVTDVKTKKGIKAVNLGKHNPRFFAWKGNRIIIDVNYAIYEMTLDNTELRKLLGHDDDPGYTRRGVMLWRLLSIVEDDDELIVVSGRDHRGRGHYSFHYNIYTGEITTLHDIKRGPDNAVWHYGVRDGGLQAITVKGDGELSFYSLKNEKPKLMKRFEMEHPLPFLEASETVLSRRIHHLTSPQPNIAYLAENVGSDKYRIVKYDVAQGKEIVVVYEDNKYDLRKSPDVRLNAQGDVVSISYLRERYTTKWLDPKLQELQEKINKKFPGRNNRMYQYSDDLSVALFVSDDRAMQKDYIYESNEDTATLFVDKSAAIKDYKWPSRKVVDITARDGTLLESYLTLPADFNGEPIPVVVMPVRLRYGRYLDGTNGYAMYLASRGYGVLAVNHRGAYGFGMDYYIGGVKDQFSVATNDIVDAAKWLGKKGIAEAGNMFLFGRQAGGSLGLLTTIRSPEVFDAVAAVSAPIDIANEISDYKKYDIQNGLEYYKVALNGKMRKKGYKALSPIYQMDKISIPALFVYGEKNTMIGEKKLTKAFKKSGFEEGHFSSVFIAGEKDSIKKNINSVYVAETVVDFFDRNVSSGE